jgi:hypothetical protein
LALFLIHAGRVADAISRQRRFAPTPAHRYRNQWPTSPKYAKVAGLSFGQLRAPKNHTKHSIIIYIINRASAAPSVVTSKAAIRGHFKTGHSDWPKK